ncbi:MAG: peptide ABC transporter substrate-binding protein [Chlamydiales bacterium]|nr:peptide ABC transporter substrate-binding protein [Chlamydiales bacterium]
MKQSLHILGLLLFFLTVACSSIEEKRGTEKTLRLNFTQCPPTLDPRKSGDIISSTFIFMMFEGLTKITPSSSCELGLAKQIDISPDLLCYTFTLKDSYWSNGDPITSYDFAASWKNILDPSFPAPNANLLYPIKHAFFAKKGLVALDDVGIECPDEKTLIVTLDKPTPYFLELTSFCTYFPIHPSYRSTFSIDPSMENLISCGPFLLQYLKKNADAKLIKNPYYYDKDNIHIDQIAISFVSDDLVALEMFEKGEIDLVGASFSQLPLEAKESVSFKENLKTVPISSTLFCAFNTKKHPLNNICIRKALSLCINRKEIVENITQLNEVVAQQIIPPILKSGNNTPLYEDYNEEKAKKLFEKGLEELQMSKKDFPTLTYTYLKTHYFTKIAQAIQEQWRKSLGVDVQLIGYDFKIFIDHLVNKNYQVAQAIWMSQYNDPMDILDRFRAKDNPKNYPDWENNEYKEILYLLDNEQRLNQRMYYAQQAEQIIINESPITCIYHFNYSYISKSNIKNFYISPIGSVHLNYIRID